MSTRLGFFTIWANTGVAQVVSISRPQARVRDIEAIHVCMRAPKGSAGSLVRSRCEQDAQQLVVERALPGVFVHRGARDAQVPSDGLHRPTDLHTAGCF